MGDLRDQFKKAGLLNKKDLKRLRHEDRVRHKQEGQGAADRDLARSKAEFEKQKAAKREADRHLEARRQEERRKKERLDRLKAMVESQAIKQRGRGRKFYFETRQGMVPFMELDPDRARLLEAGNLAIVDLPWTGLETFALVPRDLARELEAFDSKTLLFLAG